MTLGLTAFFLILSTASAAPFYVIMMAAPRAGFTRRVLGSIWPIALPSIVYVAFVLAIVLTTQPDIFGLWRALYVDNRLFSTGAVQLLSGLYGTFPEMAILHGWAHLVVGDLFIARWAYCDALQREAPSWMIAATAGLISFVGPIALVLYLLFRSRFAHRDPHAHSQTRAA